MKKIILIVVMAVLCVGSYEIYENKNRSNPRMALDHEKVTNGKTMPVKIEQHVERISSETVVSNDEQVKSAAQIHNVPLIMQLPELKRGCEVTSLAMLLQHAGVDVDKMGLAQNIKKDITPYKHVNGEYFYGNPNTGFVGDMYTFDKMGYGVYHKPVAELAEKYLPGRILDISGRTFQEVLKQVSNGNPVWIITNSRFTPLLQSEFHTWNTPTGQVQITWREHSVVVTGYDKTHVYINDPLFNQKARKLPIENFIKAWEQMGSQAITYK